MINEIKELRVSNDAQHDPEELQRRIADEGYLFFKRLVDPDRVWDLRREMMGTLQQVGWLVAGADQMDGIADINMRYSEGDNEYSAGYAKAYGIENFHRSAHGLEYLDIIEKMVAPIMPHPFIKLLLLLTAHTERAFKLYLKPKRLTLVAARTHKPARQHFATSIFPTPPNPICH